ncbi:MAG: fibronectin type III domain-containing protein [Bacteroidota bacterium]
MTTTGKDVTGTQASISGLQANTQYFIRLRAVNESGESTNSDTKFITTQSGGGLNNQIITFNALPVKVYGDAPFTLSGTSTSGLVLSYMSSNESVATVSGSTVTILGSGTTTITALQTGNTSFNAAPAVEQTLIVRAAEPGAQPGSLAFINITADAMNGSFTQAANSPIGYVVLRNTNAITDEPADGSVYVAGTSIGTSTVIYAGSSTSFTSSGLAAGTVYHYAVFAYNGNGTSINYLVSNPHTGQQNHLGFSSDTDIVKCCRLAIQCGVEYRRERCWL